VAPFASLPFAALLFAIWVVLSGKLDGFHLGAGAVTALLVSRLGHYLVLLPPAVGRSRTRPLRGIAWRRLPGYVPWLAWQIALSSVQVAWVVFDPRLPIEPTVVRLPSGLPHTLARLTLAHSITLTPGTVTLDVEEDDDTLVVHALTRESAAEVAAGEMRQAVRRLFGVGEDRA